ncbi:peptide N-acetyl-beta-D-glucosaminyl asparaginase amidase A-domain-containing protein [Copromyces sp. CBS 386.78]|nr:peptide N-acetyl-beta-D-glucosaminyl asparaginase amidase A-domain-containing protein [Copromyces sp. CBS 386.78]
MAWNQQQFLRPLLYPGNPADSISSSYGLTYSIPVVPRRGTYGTMNMASSDVEKRVLVVDKAELIPRSVKQAQTRRILLSVLWLFASLFVTSFVFYALGIPSCRRSDDHEPFSPITSTSNGTHAPQVEGIDTTRLANLDSLKPQPKERQIQTSVTSLSAAAEKTVLRNFEVAPPVLMPYGPADSDGTTPIPAGSTQKACTVLLMRRDFAFSYGDPYIGDYTPPSCKFNRVVMNFTVVSEGRQYDRLALMYLGDTEVWRTSTAEPVAPPGIRWEYLKDMTEYLSLWQQKQKIIFDLGNLVNDKYTGIFNTTLTATFFNSDVATNAAPLSDLIIPVSARQSANNAVSQFTLPKDNATNTISNFPRNARRAVFSVSANGQGNEEFWWSNVLQSDVNAFSDTVGELPGYSPFREVQVLIDGQLAGVYWPFPVIFTGGVVPSLHRPIAGIEAFDLKEHEIDMTPWLAVLTDGKPHEFTIRIAGINDTASPSGHTAVLTDHVNESWYVTGKIFIWTGAGNSPSIGNGNNRKPPTIDGLTPSITLSSIRTPSTGNSSTPESITYTTSVKRSLHIRSPLGTWTQSLSYTNKGLVSAQGYNQLNDMLISGSESWSPSTNDDDKYKTSYTYPLYANSSYSVSPTGNLSISGHLIQGKTVSLSGAAVFPDYDTVAFNGNGNGKNGPAKYRESRLETEKEGEAWYEQTGDGKNSTGSGDSRQRFTFGGVETRSGRGEELYFRDVESKAGRVVRDVKRLGGQAVATGYEVVVEGGGGGERGKGGRGDDAGVFGGVPVDGGEGVKGDGVKRGGAMRMFLGRNRF